MLENNIGLRIKKLLERENLSQRELANAIGSSESTISRYIQNKRVPYGDTLTRLAKALNTTSDFLLTGKEETEQPLNDRDKKDIEKDLKKIMDDFRDGESGPVYFDGIELDEDDMDKLEIAMRTALEIAKVKNKEKYTPKKYKK